MEENFRKFGEINPFVREVGLQKNDSWHRKSRKIYDFEMMYCFCGCAHTVIDGKEYHLSPGSLLLIPPNTPHLFWSESGMHSECFYCHFDFIYKDSDTAIFDFYNDIDQYLSLFRDDLLNPEWIRSVPVFEGGYHFPCFLQVRDADYMATLFRKLHKSYVCKSKVMDITLKCLFLEILQIVLSQTVEEDSYTSLNHRAVVENMKTFIKENYNRRISVKEIAESVNLCADHASRIFKKVTGVRIVEFITRFRITKAKTLMLYPNLSLEEIAHMVGFESENYFSQTVRKYEGQTPVSLRASIYNELNRVPSRAAKSKNLSATV